METELKRIWGIEYQEIYTGGDFIMWRLFVREPFNQEGWKVGINEKLIRKAQQKRVNKFLLVVGQREIPMRVPTKKDIKRLDKSGEFEIKQSLFEGSDPMKIYFFKIDTL